MLKELIALIFNKRKRPEYSPISKQEQNQSTLLRFRLAQRELPKPKPMTFKQAKAGKVEARLQYIRYRWHTYNNKKFGGKLQEPRFSFNAGRNSLACWRKSSPIHGERHLIPEIAVRQILFKETKGFLDMVILHEMCHQADTELGKCPVTLSQDEEAKAIKHEYVSSWSWAKLVCMDEVCWWESGYTIEVSL